MSTRGNWTSAMMALILVALPWSGQALAQDTAEEPPWGYSRWEFWLGPMFWPGLADLEPESGRFDDVGLGLGGGVHVPVRRFENSDLLVGIDFSVAATESNIDGFLSDVMARHFYFGVGSKWMFGQDRNVSLDAGIGFHQADMAEVSTTYWGMEYEIWSKSRLGGYLGATWDISRSLPGKKNGLSLSFKAHFVDFGEVYDEDTLFLPIFGSGAGQLDGPIYMVQVAYSAR